jgi:hypothetical protein
MKATTLLRDRHRSLQGLLARAGRERDALPLVLQLVEELMTHLSIEDHFFLCPVADTTGLRVDAYRESQGRVRDALLQAVFAEQDGTTLQPRLGELGSALEQHARLLERDLLPLVESQMRAEQLEAMGGRMQAFWEAAIAHERPVQPHAAEHVTESGRAACARRDRGAHFTQRKPMP